MNCKMRGEISVTAEDEFSHILERALNDVQDRNKGALYECIGVLAPESADEIRRRFSIKPSGSFYDDLQVLSQIPSFRPILERIDPIMNIRDIPVVSGFIRKSMDLTRFFNPASSAGAIVFVALVLLGLWNLRQSKDKSITSSGERERGTVLQRKRLSADLCLVIPCSRITQSLRSQLRNNCSIGNDFPPNETATLVNDSVYFLAIASVNEPILQLNHNWRDFPEGSDLFVRLRISDGEGIINTDLKRKLSQAISLRDQIISIEEIGLLNDFNGLEKFHQA
jgi:hypothetical protein